jgi:hypothetical protein
VRWGQSEEVLVMFMRWCFLMGLQGKINNPTNSCDSSLIKTKAGK